MADKTSTFTTRIFLNDQQAKSKLESLEKDIKRLRNEQEAVAKAGDWTKFEQVKKDLKQANKEMDAMKTSAQKVSHVLDNLKTSSIKEIRQTMGAINRELKSGAVARNSQEWKFLNEQLKRCKQELQNVNQESKTSKSLWSRFFSSLNTNWGAFTQILGAITGLSVTIRKCVKDFADMDQAMVNVQKYTGQTKEQVEEMNEDFKKMNTRTSRDQLNELAGAAGRLGITAKKNIEEFVDAADKINVSLGDDLGEGAVDKIGKLAQVFGEDKTKGLRGAMLATGSAVNELAQSSSANAGYIVDFAADLAGVGRQAGMSQQEIMGLASALDQNMQEEKTAATVFSQLITKMYQDPAKFAAIAGIKVKEFTKLLKEDANKALLEFMQSMQNKGGFAELAPMFESMNLDGTRAVGVLSAVATHLDQVRKAQDVANTAYASGTSVLQEFNTQNSSVQAKMDMAKKQFKEVSIALGKELLPVVQYTISASGLIVKGLYTIISYTKQHIGTLITLASTIAIVTAVYSAAYIKEKAHAALMVIVNGLHKAETFLLKAKVTAITAAKLAYYLLTGQIKKAKEAMLAMRAASITNPYAALTAVVLALGVAIYKIISAIKAHNKAMHDNLLSVRQARAAAQDLNEAIKERNQSTAEERTRLERLTNIINSNVYSYNEKKNAMIALEKIVPGYHRNLRNEASLTASNNRALKEYVERLNDAAMAQALYNRMVALQGKQFDLQEEIRRHENSRKAVQAEINRHPDKYNATTNQVYTTGYGSAMIGPSIPTEENYQKHKELQQWVDLTKKASDNLKVVQYQIKSINDYMKANKGVSNAYNKLVENGTGSGGSAPEWSPSTSSSNKPYVEPKKAAKAAKAAETARKKAEAAAKKHENEMKAATRKAYQEEIKAAKGKTDEEQAQNIMAYSQGKKKYSEYLNDQHDIAIKGYKSLEAIYKKYGTDYGQWQDEVAKEEQKKQEDNQKALLSDVELNRQRETFTANEDYNKPDSEIYHNEEALNERLFEIDMAALADRTAVLQEGSQEWLDAKAEMTQKEEEHELYLQQHYAELLSQYREQWGNKDVKDQELITLNGLDTLHEKGIVKEQEYQEMLHNIKLHYALEESQNKLNNSKGEQFKRNADTAYQTASNNAKADYQNEHPTGTGVGDYYTSDVTIYASTLANIKKMEQQGVVTHQEAMAAMSQATSEMCQGMAAKMQAAYDAISPIMSAMSSYYSAQSDYEVTITEKKYDKMIEKAGNNTAKSKKLEEKKQKEVAKIKTKYAKKQMKMEIAQAIVQTAMSAIAAYGSAMSGVPYPANLVLAPIAAGIALAAGAIQIATIKKQQQAQEAGYYEGGFTGGSRYRREAGVVHEGEFVANHNAVNNPQLLPALRLIDVAQRNNTVGRLTAADVSRAMGTGGATVVSAPTVNVQTDNSELAATLQQARDTFEKIGSLLDGGITANVSMEDFKKQEKHWDNIQNNK